MPTSTTTTPSLTMSAVMDIGFPIAATRMSACNVISDRFFVRVWHTVTVAFDPGRRCINKLARGLPTMLLRPQTTTLHPSGSYPLRTNNCWMPAGVPGM